MKLSTLVAPDAPERDVEIVGLTADSREVRPGFLFAALPGVKQDGQAFIADALRAGAAAILAPPGAPTGDAPIIADDNPRRRLAEFAARFYPRQPETLVAVTGTNGKSSTVEFLRQIWAADGRSAATVGTLGATTPSRTEPLAHTTPEPVALHRMLDWLAAEGVSCAAIEASSHGLAQHRLDAARLSAVSFTNLTQDHLDYHASLEEYFATKLRLFTELAPAGAPAVINVDSDWGRRVADAADGRGLDVRTVGWRGAAVKICELIPRPASQTVSLKIDGAEREIDLPLVGEFQALNAVQAAGLALATGVTETAVLAALAGLKGVRGRMEYAGATAEGAPIFVDFAHTPDGLDKLLRALRPHTKERIVLVFGAGGDRDPTKRKPMGQIAARLADAVIVTDDNPRSEEPAVIREAVLEGCPGATEIADRGEAIAIGARMLKKGDAMVIAGKGHETGQEIGGRIVPFDDVEAARAAITARGGHAGAAAS